MLRKFFYDVEERESEGRERGGYLAKQPPYETTYELLLPCVTPQVFILVY
jgi:hypothetical protein